LSLAYLSLALFSGIAFSVFGVTYRLGQDRRVSPPQIMLLVGLAGSAFFAADCWGKPLGDVPADLWALALVAGAGQVLAVRLFGVALARGGLAGPWCAVSLPFVPTFLYGRFFLGGSISLLQALAMAAAGGCVLAASLQQKKRQAPETLQPRRAGFGAALAYFFLLLAMLIGNGLEGVAMAQRKLVLSSRPELEGITQSAMCLVLYGGITLGLLIVLGWSRTLRAPLKWWLVLGAVSTVGSILGITSLFVSTAHGVSSEIGMTLSGIGQILTVALLAVSVFGEKADRLWLATVGLGVMAVVLANLEAILPARSLPALLQISF
jgi:drug/metabolite transporter (DMT)-like permease